MGYLRCIKFI